MNNRWPVPGRALTVLLFLSVFCLRLPYLANSPYEYDSWRQSDTESMARHFVESKFNIFYPQLNYDGPLPNYVQLELQITTFLIALLYKMFGYHYALARIVPVAFFMGSAFFLFLIARHYYSLHVARLGVLIYGILPLNLLYSRAIMPESAALFFSLGAFYFFSRWIAREKLGTIIAAGCFTALAILEKVPTAFIGIPMLVMALVKYKRRIWARGELWLFAALSLVPPYAYFAWLGRIAESPFVSGIATKHILPHMLTALFTKEAAAFFFRELPKAFTWYAIALFAAGLCAVKLKREYPIWVWSLAMLLELATVVAVIRFNYYLIFLGPPLSILSAKTLAAIGKVRTGALWSALIVVLLGVSSWQQIRPFYGMQHTELLKQAEIAQAVTAKTDLLVVGTDDPSLLNACHRQGWRVTNAIPDDPIAELNYYIGQGAAYFVPLKGFIYGDDGRLKSYLEAHFPAIEKEAGYVIYKLR